MTIHSEHQKLDKWVKAISPQDTVNEAAKYSLHNRLASVQQFLPRAAVSDIDSIEDVHQLRVATRRVLAVLQLYAELLPTKPTKSLRRSLKKIQRAGGAVRDLDVLAQRFCKVEHNNAKKLVKTFKRRRSRMQLRLTKLYLRLRQDDRFLNQIEKFPTKIGASDTSNERAGTWMKMRWAQLVEQFYQVVNVDLEDLDALHRFRISSKQLRYGLELLAPAFDPMQLERAYAFVERLQDRLGRIHDHVIACEMFRIWDAKRNRVSRTCKLKLFIDGESEILQKEQRDLVTWWTASLQADMREAFDQLAMLDPT